MGQGRRVRWQRGEDCQCMRGVLGGCHQIGIPMVGRGYLPFSFGFWIELLHWGNMGLVPPANRRSARSPLGYGHDQHSFTLEQYVYDVGNLRFAMSMFYFLPASGPDSNPTQDILAKLTSYYDPSPPPPCSHRTFREWAVHSFQAMCFDVIWHGRAVHSHALSANSHRKFWATQLGLRIRQTSSISANGKKQG